MGELTICSVSYESRRHLEENHRLTEILHDGRSPCWLVVENSPVDSSWCISADDRRFQRLPSIRTDRRLPGYGSYQHGTGLNRALSAVRTRFVLLLDPDFFLVAPRWIPKSLDWMKRKELVFFGAPYFPSRRDKYRYFPCASCMFIDLEQIERRSLDFEPEILERVQAESLGISHLLKWLLKGKAPVEISGTPGRLPALETLYARAASHLPEGLREWILIRSAYWSDVGVRVHRKYSEAHGGLDSVLSPVWENALFERPPKLRSRAVRSVVRGLLPDRFSRAPKNRQYCRPTGFAELGLRDHRGEGFEEYFLGDEPFAVHFSGTRRTSASKQQQVEDALSWVVACHSGQNHEPGECSNERPEVGTELRGRLTDPAEGGSA